MLALALLVIGPQPASAEGRIALVVGNGTYEGLERLRNPVSDAKLIARTLRTLNFDVVEQTDADERAMKGAIQDFGRRIASSGRDTVSLFYYAGHGVQVNGTNYLVPVKSRLQRESDVDFEAVDVGLVLRQMEEAGSRVNIIILDACRNNPLPRGVRSVARGLAGVSAPQGSLIAYSTAPGSASVDGNGANSPYTDALASAMSQPGLSLEEMFRQVRVRVLDATYGQQVTWESSSLTGAFYFSPTSTAADGISLRQQAIGVPPRELHAAVSQQRTPRAPADDPTVRPRAATRGDIAGQWEGRYQCQQQEIGVSLTIAAAEGDRVAAIFEFFPLPGMLSFPRGSFRLFGDYSRADGNLRLQSTDWIKRSVGFQKHDIEGQIADNGTMITGRILTVGCAHFILTRK